MTVLGEESGVRALLRAIYYAVIVGVGIDAFFFAWLLAEDRYGLSRADAQRTAVIVACVATIIMWATAATGRSLWLRRAAARRTATLGSAAVVATSPLASGAARDRAKEMAAFEQRAAVQHDGSIQQSAPAEVRATGNDTIEPDDTTEPDENAEHDGNAAPDENAAPDGNAAPYGNAALDENPLLDGSAEAARAADVDDEPGTFELQLGDATLLADVAMVDSVAVSEANLAESVRLYGRDDPRALRSKAVLACAYWAAGDLDRAIPQFEETVAAAVQVLGDDHLETLTWRSDLAAAYELAGRLDDAIEVYELALAGRERTLGTNHPDTQLVRSNLAVATAVRANLARGRGPAGV